MGYVEDGYQILMEGSIVMALSGERAAARHARSVGEALLATYPASPGRA